MSFEIFYINLICILIFCIEKVMYFTYSLGNLRQDILNIKK